MEHSQANDDRILDVWSWCSDAYLRHGRRLSLPVGTDPTKTYQWRYATKLASKFTEWKLSEEASKKFIDIAVKIAKENQMLKKGLAIFHQNNMLTLCYEQLCVESESNKLHANSIKFIHAWLHEKCADRPVLEVLLDRNDPESYCNLTMWFQASRLSPLYLAISKACRKALEELESHEDERSILPRSTELYLLRQSFYQDAGNVAKVRAIFEKDWRKTCQ